MARIHIICGRYYDFESQCQTIGGIQSYISSLTNVIEELEMQCILYQPYTIADECNLGNVKIIQIAVRGKTNFTETVKMLLERCKENFDIENDILIFNTDSRVQKNFAKKSITIQHGICWDIPRHQNKSPLFNSIYTFNRSREAFKILRRLRNVGNVVCVDYNFPNWYRSVAAYEAVPLKVIPNFTRIAEKNEKPKDKINIIFCSSF